MSAVRQVREPRADYLKLEEPALLRGLDLLATAEGGVTKLRDLILSLAVRGKLVPQVPSESPVIPPPGYSNEPGPVPKLGELPDGWVMCSLGQFAPDLQNGLSSRGDAGGSPTVVLRLADIQQGRISFADTRTLSVHKSSVGKYALRGDDVLIVRVNGSSDLVGRFVLCEREIDAIYCDHFIRMRIDQKLIDPRYLIVVAESPLVRACISALFITTAGQKTVNQGHIASLPVPLPPLAEQARIVARVEELMQLCDALEAHGRLQDEQHARLVATLLDALAASESAHALANNWQRIAAHFDLLLDRPKAVDALEQTLLQLAVRGLLVPQDPTGERASELLARIRAEKSRAIAEGKIKRDKPLSPVPDDQKPFEARPGWEWVPFGTLVNISSGITLGRKTTPMKPVTLPYLRVANVQRWHLDLDHLKTITVAESELPRFLLKPGDLLLTEGGDWDKVGRTCIWQGHIEACLHQNHVFKARGVLTEWSPAWAELYLNSTDARTYFAGASKQTTNLASINSTQLKSCPFPVPPLAEQHRIVARVEQLRRLCAELREHLQQARATQSSLADAWVAQAAR